LNFVQKKFSCNLFLIIAAIFILPACFGGGVDKRGSVQSYKNGIVATEGGRFRIGSLSNSWFQKNIDYKALFFVSRRLQASITVDAFCKGSFDDAPLPILSQQLFYNLERYKIKSQKDFQLDDRAAQRTLVEGKLDGAAVVMDAVVMKKNECVFDFVYTSLPADYQEGKADFESLYQGFKYISGPRID